MNKNTISLIELCQNSMSNVQETLEKKTNNISVNNIDIKMLRSIKISHEDIIYKLTNLARIDIKHSNLIHIIPYDKINQKLLKTKILISFSYLNVVIYENKLILSLPIPTMEQRLKIIKIIKIDNEDAKIKLRNIRRYYNNQIKKMYF